MQFGHATRPSSSHVISSPGQNSPQKSHGIISASLNSLLIRVSVYGKTISAHGIYTKKAPHVNEKLFAVRMGLEPTTSGVTGPHSNQLNYRTGLFAAFGVSLKCVAKLRIFLELAIA